MKRSELIGYVLEIRSSWCVGEGKKRIKNNCRIIAQSKRNWGLQTAGKGKEALGQCCVLFLLRLRRMWQGQVDSRSSLELRGEAGDVDKDLKATCIYIKYWDRVTLRKVLIWETEGVQTKDRGLSQERVNWLLPELFKKGPVSISQRYLARGCYPE